MASNFVKAAELKEQCKKLHMSFLLYGELNDIQQAVVCAEQVLDLLPLDDQSRSNALYNLGRLLFRRFLHSRHGPDIAKAIELFVHFSQRVGDGNAGKQRSCLNYLTACYFLQDINLGEVLQLNDSYVNIHSKSSDGFEVNYHTLIFNLDENDVLMGYVWELVWKPLGLSQPNLQDVNFSIQLCRQALKFFTSPPSDPIKIAHLLCWLGYFLNVRYEGQRQLEDNAEAIDCFCHAFEKALQTDDIGLYLTYASIAFRNRYEAYGEQKDLDSAEDLARHSLTMLEAYDHTRFVVNTFGTRDFGFSQCLDNLGRIMSHRGRSSTEVNDSIHSMEVLTGNPATYIVTDSDSGEDLPVLLSDFTMNLRSRHQGALSSPAEEGELKLRRKRLFMSCVLTDSLDDIQEAVHCAEKVLALIPPGVTLIPDALYNLARPMLHRFLHTRQSQDITMAIQMFRCACQPLAQDDPLHQKCCRYLTVCYFLKGGNLYRFLGLDETSSGSSQSRLPFSVEAVLMFSLGEGEEVYAYLFDGLCRISNKSSLEDLDSALQLQQQAVKLLSPSRSQLFAFPMLLFNIGGLLVHKHFRQNGSENLEEGMNCFCRALELGLPVEYLQDFLSKTADNLVMRYDALKKTEDLERAKYLAQQGLQFNEALYHAKEAMGIRGAQQKGVAQSLHSLAAVHRRRYSRATGELNDVNVAIGLLKRAVGIAERDHSLKGLHQLLHSLGVCFDRRFEITSQDEDSKLAIEMFQRAVDLADPKDPCWTESILALSKHKIFRGNSMRDDSSKEEAVTHLREALSIRGMDPESDAQKDFELMACIAFANGDLDFIDGTAMTRLTTSGVLSGMATQSGCAPFPAAEGRLSTLALTYFHQWMRTRDFVYIKAAMSIAADIIRVSTCGSDDWVKGWEIRGLCLCYAMDPRTQKDDEFRKVATRTILELLLELFHISECLASSRFAAVCKAIDLLIDDADWKRVRQLSLEAIDLLQFMNGQSVGWKEKLFWVRLNSHNAVPFASIALEAGDGVMGAIDILERFRGSILGHLIDSRTDIDALIEAAPEKAKCFRALQNEINTATGPSEDLDSRVEQTIRRSEAEVELRACLQDIRKLDGFQGFLLGPTETELKEAAALGPIIVVNISRIRSDAFIIREHGLDLLRLPGLKYKDVKKYVDMKLTNFGSDPKELGTKNKKFRQLQKWLWNNCVKLIFDRLDGYGDDITKRHVWWIGVGIAQSLPFHVAGIYEGDFCETALDRAISSYALTLKLLLHGRKKLKNNSLVSKTGSAQQKPRLAIITMPSTPGSVDDLTGVLEEADEIQSIVQDSFSGKVFVQPNVEDVKVLMTEYEVMHFACHGMSASTAEDPSNSHLLLQATDPESGMPVVDKLNVRDMAAANLCNGKLAFLSACTTAQNLNTDLPDEGIHLASGCQIAGYSHAIGNIWLADDEVSVQIVKQFYKHLLKAGDFGDGHNVARALNAAMLDVARHYAGQPLCWASFVHFGV